VHRLHANDLYTIYNYVATLDYLIIYYLNEAFIDEKNGRAHKSNKIKVKGKHK